MARYFYLAGEFQQLQTVKDEEERFQLYLKKTFNKTASLIAYSCKANAILSFEHFNASLTFGTPRVSPDDAYQYGRNIGIAFQLIDDLLGKILYPIPIHMSPSLLQVQQQNPFYCFYVLFYPFICQILKHHQSNWVSQLQRTWDWDWPLLQFCLPQINSRILSKW